MNLPKTELTNDKIDEILIPMLFGEEGMAKQDGSSLMGQIVYSQNSKLSKSREKITHLIHQAEIKARIDELKYALESPGLITSIMLRRIKELESDNVRSDEEK